MNEEFIVFSLPRPEAELLYAQLSDLADATRDEAEDEHDERIGETLDHIADLVHTALHGREVAE
jgi:hypothetical protein